MILAHSIALDPNRKQSEYFARAAGTARFAYNNALSMWNEEYRANGKANPGKLRREFNATRRERFPWMNEVSSYVYAYPLDTAPEVISGVFPQKGEAPEIPRQAPQP